MKETISQIISNVLHKVDSIIKEIYFSELIPYKQFVRILIKVLQQVFQTWHIRWMVVTGCSTNTETELGQNPETNNKLFLESISIDFSFGGWLNHVWNWNFRSSHQRCSVRKGVLRNFTKFIGKHLCQSLIFNKVGGLRPTALLKKRLRHRYFPADFVEFPRTPILQNTSGRLPLNFQANYHKANQSFVQFTFAVTAH